MDKTMTEHHDEDYRAERKHRAVVRAIDDLLKEPRRVWAHDREVLQEARDRCKRQADHIVRIWD